MSNAFGVTDVADLLDMMERWGIAEVHLAAGESSLDLVRAIAPAVHAPVTAHPTTIEVPAVAGMPVEAEPVIVRAPVVGMFHLARRGFPQGSPHPGDAVGVGQVIGNIELMHVPSDLYAPMAGVIEAILVDDGAGVEYDQPLMIIRPEEEGRNDEADTHGASAH